MKDAKWDELKSMSQMIKEADKVCFLKDCGQPLTPFKGEGSSVLCRVHQLDLVERGGMGRIDRPHTFYRSWICDECNTDILQDPRLKDIEDEMMKRRIGRVLMHGDHNKVRKADGGEDTSENIRSLCYVCHAKKTMMNEDYKK
jgi:5-methylcytosine-specific restriction endonuclease McrA